MARVLIVDDSRLTRAMLRGLLAGLGHNVVGEAEDVEPAIKAFKSLTPDLVTLDLVLPGGSGMDVLKSMRQTDPRANVIVVTASGQTAVATELMRLGAKAVLQKPFTGEDLKKALANPAVGRTAPQHSSLEEGLRGAYEAMARLSGHQWTAVPLDAAAEPGAKLAGVRFDIAGQPFGPRFLLAARPEALAKYTSWVRERSGAGENAGESATLAETGNIVISALLNALADDKSGPLLPTPPRLTDGTRAQLGAELSQGGRRVTAARFASAESALDLLIGWPA